MVMNRGRHHVLMTVLLFLVVVIYSIPASADLWLEVEEEMSKALEKNPHDPLLHFKIGVSYAKTGRVEEAFERFNILKEMEDDIDLEESPSIFIEKIEEEGEEGEDYIINLSYLAFSYHVINEYEKCRRAFEELILLEPDNIWNYNFLALVYRDLKLFKEAERVLEKSLMIEKNSFTRFILGLVYYDLGHYIKALIEFGRARDVARTLLELQ